MPHRIQRRRTKGWRMPLCSCGCGRTAIYVGRGTRWGNPHQVGTRLHCSSGGRSWTRPMTAWDATDFFAADVRSGDGFLPFTIEDLHAHLRGHDLACWCPTTGQPCHADVLLELANRGDA